MSRTASIASLALATLSLAGCTTAPSPPEDQPVDFGLVTATTPRPNWSRGEPHPANTGTSRLFGRVVDQNGHPIPGAELIAEAKGPAPGLWRALDERPPAPQPGDGPHVGSGSSGAFNVNNKCWIATADEDGEFAIGGLASGLFTVQLLGDAVGPARTDLRTNEEAVIIAERAWVHELDLRLPDGRIPSSAIVEVIDVAHQASTWTWTPETPRLRTPGRFPTISVVAGDLLRTSDGTWLGRFASGPIPLGETDGARDPVEVLLGEATDLRVRIAPDCPMPAGLECTASLTHVATGRTRMMARTGRRGFAVSGVSPGEWNLSMKRSGAEPEVVRRVSIARGANALELDLGPLDPTRYFAARFVDEQGVPLCDVDSVRYEASGSSRKSAGSLDVETDATGTAYVDRQALADRLQFTPVELRLRFHSKSRGKAAPVRAHDQEGAEVVFLPPCELVVDLDLSAFEELDRLRVNVFDQRAGDTMTWTESRYVPRHGLVGMGPLQPGPVRIVVRSRTSGFDDLCAQELELEPGPLNVSMTVPGTYEIAIAAPGAPAGTTYTLRRYDPRNGQLTVGRSGLAADAAGNIVAKDLSAGRHVLTRFVPTPGVQNEEIRFDVLEPPATFAQGLDPDRWQVSAIEPGSIAERLGLRIGDILVSVDGEASARHDFPAVIRRELADSSVGVTVQRGAKELTLRLDFAVPDRNDPPPLGASIFPRRR